MEKMHDDFSHLNTGPFSVPNMVSQLDSSIYQGWPGLKKGQIPQFCDHSDALSGCVQAGNSFTYSITIQLNCQSVSADGHF